MLTATLTQNRCDQARFVRLVTYEAHTTENRFIPIQRTYEVVDGGLKCVRVRELKYSDIKREEFNS